MILFFDTETTGKYDFNKPYQDHKQPDVLQIGALLDDEQRRTVAKLCFLVALRPDAVVEPGAFSVHGIAAELANKYGLQPLSMVKLFDYLYDRAEMVVGHNIDFDLGMLRVAHHRLEAPWPAKIVNKFCTMRNATSICKLPGRYGYKWPTLTEAYCLLVDVGGFAGAHDALADVEACRAIYYALQDRSVDKQPEDKAITQ